MPGQTLREVRSLLEAAGLRPQHRFGQNFLIDLNLLDKVVAAAELTADDTVLEVGPGTGSLTGLLLGSGARVVAVEIDRGLQELVAGMFAGHAERFTLVRSDVLAGKHRLAPDLLAALAAAPPGPAGRYKLVANLPYQVATPLILELLLLETPRFERLVGTIQKEVAERFMAGAGCAAYGPVSILAQTLAEIERVAELPPQAFWPRPQVDSTLLRMRARERAALEVRSVARLSELVHRAFQARRKKLGTIIRKWDQAPTGEALRAAGIDPDLRPEAVPPAAWRRLADCWNASPR